MKTTELRKRLFKEFCIFQVKNKIEKYDYTYIITKEKNPKYYSELWLVKMPINGTYEKGHEFLGILKPDGNFRYSGQATMQCTDFRVKLFEAILTEMTVLEEFNNVLEIIIK